MDILQAMQDAKFVQVNGHMFVTGYLCMPDDELVAAVSEHVSRDHPELVGKLTRDDILGMAEEEQ